MNAKKRYAVMTGTGCKIPKKVIPNEHFLKNIFYDKFGNLITKPNEETIQKFLEVSGIRKRRYVENHLVASDIAHEAGEIAIISSGINREELDYVIVTSNFGDISYVNRKMTMVPSLAATVKSKLGIKNPKTLIKDIVLGCPGFVQGMVDANMMIKTGFAKKILVIGTETLSRVCDPHDIDSMLYADGAGAAVIEVKDSADRIGIISSAASNHVEYANLLWMGKSYNPDYGKEHPLSKDDLFIKMTGKALHMYAIKYVPEVLKEALDKAHLTLSDVNKLVIHQANAKIDNSILAETCKLYGIAIPHNIMPLTVHTLGNSSVATVPTLWDLLSRNELPGHTIKSGDIIVFASLGAGMNIYVVVYRIP